MKRKIISAIAVTLSLCITALIVHSCGIYSFTGTSIQSDVKTISISYFEYKALKVNPTLAKQMQESKRHKFIKLTKLEQVDMDGDLHIEGAITGYDVKATAVTANETAAQNRLTVSVKISFVNKNHPEDDFDDKSFSAYADFDSSLSLDSKEAELCDEIVEKLCEDIFNATVAQW